MTLAGPLAAFLSSCAWAIGVAAYARLSAVFPAAAINTTRALIALPVFLLWSTLELGGLPAALTAVGSVDRTHQLWLLASIVTSYALGDVIFLRAANLLGISAALAIASIFPLWAALAGVLFRGEALTPLRFAGVLAVVAGTIAVIVSARATAAPRVSGRSAIVPGVALAVLASLFWAANSVTLAEGVEGLSVAVASTCRMGWALLLCPLFGFATPRALGAAGVSRTLVVPWPALKPVLWAFVIEGVLGTFLFTYGLRQGPLAVAAPLSSLAPVVAVPVAVLSGTERFSLAKTAGILVVAAGIFLLLR